MRIFFILFFTIFTQASAEVIYRAQTKIGNKTFNDLITLESIMPGQPINGTLTVPGVFSVPLHAHIQDINFHIDATVLENNQSYKVRYNLTFLNYPNLFSGELLSDQGEVIGIVIGTLIYNELN